jgi:hypothetical protein
LRDREQDRIAQIAEDESRRVKALINQYGMGEVSTAN